MHTNTSIAVHETDADLYAAFVQVFGENENGEVRWVRIETTAGVTVTMFADRRQEDALDA